MNNKRFRKYMLGMWKDKMGMKRFRIYDWWILKLGLPTKFLSFTIKEEL